MEKSEFQNFWRRPDWPIFPGPFTRCGQKFKIPLPTFCRPRPPLSEEVRHDPAGPLGGNRFPVNPVFQGPGPTR